MIYTQSDIYNYLVNNPLHVAVDVGDVQDLNGADYIFLDYTGDDLIGSDNKGEYATYIQVTVATRDFENRKILVEYVKNLMNFSIAYEKDIDFEYYVARCTSRILMWHE